MFNKLKLKLIQLFCNHDEQECLSTITPHYLDNLYKGINTNTFVYRCTRCGKLIYKDIIEKKYNIFYYEYLLKSKDLNIKKKKAKERYTDETDMDKEYGVVRQVR